MKSVLQSARPRQLFWLGAGLFVIGIAGLMWLWTQVRTVDFDRVVPADAAVFAEISLRPEVLAELQTVFSEVDLRQGLEAFFDDRFAVDMETDVLPWIGDRAGVALFADRNVLLLVNHRSTRKVEAFLQKLILPGETYTVEKIGSYELWTPAFSSDIGIGFGNGQVFFSSSQALLRRALASADVLAEDREYRQIRRDMGIGREAFVFLKTDPMLTAFLPEAQAPKRPVWDALARSLPALGMSGAVEEYGFTVRTKLLSHEGIFQEHSIRKVPNQTMPELAQFAPKDVLFFMNGSDLYAKYLHTRGFLEDFDPQFGLVFEGVLRATTREWVGQEFDFEKDLLSRIKGQYAVLLDFKNAVSPFLSVTLITGFEGVDSQQSITQLHEVIQLAQQQFATEMQAIELPDGTSREELVVVDREVPIRKVEENGFLYFTADNERSARKLSYGVIGGRLVFSTHEDGLRGVLLASQDPALSLAANADFRDSVLFRSSPSESYGFLHFAKLSQALAFLTQSEVEADGTWSWAQLLRSNLRNITFARRVLPGEVFWDVILWPR